jgi:ubiquinone/menaquinone biosynthesis C-methylase UbiE
MLMQCLLFLELAQELALAQMEYIVHAFWGPMQADRTIDAVVVLEPLASITDMQKFLSEATRVLKENAPFIFISKGMIPQSLTFELSSIFGVRAPAAL